MICSTILGSVYFSTTYFWKAENMSHVLFSRPPTILAFFISHFHFFFFKSLSAARLSRGRDPRLTSDNFTCCHSETEQGDPDFYHSRPHYTDTDTTRRAQISNPRLPGLHSQILKCFIYVIFNLNFLPELAVVISCMPTRQRKT